LKDSPDVAHHKGMLDTLDEMLRECRAINPQFDVSYEGWWDRLMHYSDVTWWWPGGPIHSVKKEVFPEWVPHAPVCQPYSFNVVNSCAVHAHAMLLGPGNYSKDLDFKPYRAVADYAAEVARIRAELHDDVSTSEVEDASDRTLFNGKPKIKIGAPFTRSSDTAWTLFRNRKNGRRCLVLANYGRKPLTATGVRFGNARACQILSPFAKPKSSKLPVSVSIPPERVVFLLDDAS
jgi:hypothetical protein